MYYFLYVLKKLQQKYSYQLQSTLCSMALAGIDNPFPLLPILNFLFLQQEAHQVLIFHFKNKQIPLSLKDLVLLLLYLDCVAIVSYY